MSVGIVTIFPWQAILSLGIEGPPCASIFTDSRLSFKVGEKYVPIDHLQLSKQRVFSDNLIICYTSVNLFVTTRALDRAENASAKPSVKRIGEYLKQEHEQYGGLTELVAVVWRANSPVPQMLELMHPDYMPKPRQGIVGIGDRLVLERFKELFQNPPPSALQLVESAEFAKKHPKLFENLPPGAMRIDSLEKQTVAEIGAALTQAVEEASSDSVGYPLEINWLSKQGLVPINISIRRNDTETWERVSADPKDLSLPSNPPQYSEREKGRGSAVQLIP